VLPEPAPPTVWPAEHRLATHTGTNAPTGAVAATAGLTFVESTCTAPPEWETLWLTRLLCPLLDAAAAEPVCPADRVVEHLLAIQTGVDTSNGAATDAAGLTVAELACTAPTDWDTDCPFPASAGAAVASVTRQTTRVSTSFIVFSFR
jgi:hypothetical protein